jgi:hypothetical protein
LQWNPSKEKEKSIYKSNKPVGYKKPPPILPRGGRGKKEKEKRYEMQN